MNQEICHCGEMAGKVNGGVRMEKKYSAKYEETKDVLVALCEIFHQDKFELSILIGIGVFGSILLVLMLATGSSGAGAGAIAYFLVKYLCVWAAFFFGGDIFARTIGKSMMKSTAYGDADALQRLRIKKREKALVVEVGFYEDRIVNDTGTKQAEYLYSDIKKLLESDKAIGFLADVGPGPKRYFGVPKDAFYDCDIEEVKTYLVERCPGVKKFKKVL